MTVPVKNKVPLVEYEEVERYLELIGRQDDLNDIVVAVFPPEQRPTSTRFADVFSPPLRHAQVCVIANYRPS